MLNVAADSHASHVCIASPTWRIS